MMKNFLFFLSIFFSAVTVAKAQNNDINFAYGGSFTGFGDLQGKFMSIGYNHELYKPIHVYGVLAQASMSGQAGFKFRPDIEIIGADNLHFPLLSTSSVGMQNQLSEQYSSVGSKIRLDPPKSMMNTKNLDLGVQFYVVKGTKLGLYVEGNLSLVKLEWTGLIAEQIITINNDFWFNRVSSGKPDLLLYTNAQEHFLDWGLGYGIGLNYYLSSFLTLGANGHYNGYFNSAQNMVTWSVKFGIKLSK
jgi:hypothetical protein